MSRLQLRASQRRRLEHVLRTARDAGLFRRVLAILEVDSGRSIAETAPTPTDQSSDRLSLDRSLSANSRSHLLGRPPRATASLFPEFLGVFYSY